MDGNGPEEGQSKRGLRWFANIVVMMAADLCAPILGVTQNRWKPAKRVDTVSKTRCLLILYLILGTAGRVVGSQRCRAQVISIEP